MTDPDACAVKGKEKYFDGWKTVGHVPREISQFIYIFIKKENGKITGNVKSLNYKPSPIPSGGLEILLQLTFSCPMEWVRDKMKDFIDDFDLMISLIFFIMTKALMIVTLKSSWKVLM